MGSAVFIICGDLKVIEEGLHLLINKKTGRDHHLSMDGMQQRKSNMRVRRYPDKRGDNLLAHKTTLSIRTFVTRQIMSFCIFAKFDKRQKEVKVKALYLTSAVPSVRRLVSMEADGVPFFL